MDFKYSMPANPSYADQFKKNNDAFRNTMESIFQKYSSINDPGIDVCLKTMTCRTRRGPVPIESVDGERELESLKTRAKANQSFRELEDQENDEPMDLSGVTEDDGIYSNQNENNGNQWDDGDLLQHSMNGINSSVSCLWGVASQPEEEDEELEKTLSSHGSTLLDVYPSMLSQIGEAYRRQHVTDTARAVLQKYRRKQRQAGQSNPHSASLKNRTLNRTTEIVYNKQSPVRNNVSNCIDHTSKFQNMFKTNLKSSPLRRASSEASGCFYSPRRDNADLSGVSNESPWSQVHLDQKPEQKPACVIDFSTPPPSVSPSLSDDSPDLNQTYVIGPTVSSTSRAVQASLVSTCPQPVWGSPGRQVQPIIEQRRMSVTPRSCNQPPPNSLLDKDRFRDRLHSSISSPQRGLSSFSPSRKSTFRPTSMLKTEIQQSTAIQSPEKRSPLRYQAHSEMHRSSYGGKEAVMSSPQRSLYHRLEHQQSFSMAEKQSQISPRLSKPQSSLLGSLTKSTNLVKHDSSSRPQIDAEFRKLYHHFICHGTSSPCASSCCYLCERQQKKTPQSPGFSSSSMSALALTPLRATLKKRRRLPEVEESLRFKRFRESRSPIKHLQVLPHQLKDGYMTSSMAEPNEDKHTWERAILLQCPSPQFLRGTGNLRRIRESKLSMQVYPTASSWKDIPSRVYAVKAESPLRPFNQGMTPFSPSFSRRRLQYSLLQ